jgi:hypothetical protein
MAPVSSYPTPVAAAPMPTATMAATAPLSPSPTMGSIRISDTPPPAPEAAPTLSAPATAPAAPSRPIYGAGPFDTPLPATAASNDTPPEAEQGPVTSGSVPSSARAANFNYTFSGANGLIPKTIFDDGERTFMEFKPNVAIPELYVVTQGDTFVPVTTDRSGKYVVIPTVASRIMLRLNGQVATMFNETRQ